MRSDSGKCREIQDKHFMFNFFFFFNRVFHEIMWKKIVETGRPQMTIWRVRVACWITKALRICNVYWFSIAKMVTRTHFKVTSYRYRASCYVFRNEQWLSFNNMLIYYFCCCAVHIVRIISFIPIHAQFYTLKKNFTLLLKKLKNSFKKFAPTCFGPYLRTSSGGSWACRY
jgi:hypothetical protein